MSYILYECASGYGLFERLESGDIELQDVRDSCTDLAKFSKQVKLKAFIPFISAEMALDNINSVSEGDLNDYLKNFLEQNLPKSKSVKKCKFSIGVSDPRMGTCIQDELSFKCESGEVVNEMLRGIRNHFTHFIKALRPGDLEKAQLGLGHSYSRAKVKFNVHRVDNMIIQAIALLDQLDKDLNTFAMRVREWYGWHFPELARITSDNIVIAKLARLIQNRNNLTEAMLPQIEEITGDTTMAKEIVEASKASMGTDISLIDMINIKTFADRVVSLNEYRMQLHQYLKSKMSQCAPNLSALIGEMVGARLISHAGSLTNLAKYPASTVQILGAEKALFRALKTKGNTPKYGLIFHSSFIGRAAQKNKGRISRYLANKCSIASRVDSFSEVPNSIYGEKLRSQVEERLAFYETGATPRKNADVMAEAGKAVKAANPDAESEDEQEDKATKKKSKKDKKDKKSKKKKRKAEEEVEEAPTKKKSKKDKKDKKSKKKSKKKKSSE